MCDSGQPMVGRVAVDERLSAPFQRMRRRVRHSDGLTFCLSAPCRVSLHALRRRLRGQSVVLCCVGHPTTSLPFLSVDAWRCKLPYHGHPRCAQVRPGAPCRTPAHTRRQPSTLQYARLLSSCSKQEKQSYRIGHGTQGVTGAHGGAGGATLPCVGPVPGGCSWWRGVRYGVKQDAVRGGTTHVSRYGAVWRGC